MIEVGVIHVCQALHKTLVRLELSRFKFEQAMRYVSPNLRPNSPNKDCSGNEESV